jgi:hypothetical protein
MHTMVARPLQLRLQRSARIAKGVLWQSRIELERVSERPGSSRRYSLGFAPCERTNCLTALRFSLSFSWC